MVQVKICGITNLEDAKQAIAAGADYLGLIFASSPRQISLEKAKIIATAKLGKPLVGVFVDGSIETIRHYYAELGLSYVQLHGQETPDYAQTLGLPYIKAFRIGTTLENINYAQYPNAYALLLDKKQGEPAFPLEFATKIQTETKQKIFLAGGLSPANVAAAIKTVKPFAVDVASGVEKTPGSKDHELVKKFIQEARS